MGQMPRVLNNFRQDDWRPASRNDDLERVSSYALRWVPHGGHNNYKLQYARR